tara:strand:- start:143 stop:877 length:735 start_codon:yes stop_codon:yes gene_type:complete
MALFSSELQNPEKIWQNIFMQKLTIFFVTIILISSCATVNPYTQYYQQYTEDYYPPSFEVETRTTSAENYADAINQLLTEGYEQIGESSFNGGMFDTTLAVSHAETIGAEIVLLAQKFTDTNTYTSSVVSYGFGVAPVTSTQRRFDQNATYFAKRQKPLKFGVGWDVLSSEDKSKNETNYGLKVLYIVNNSPMFKAGVIPGDIIVEMDGRKLITSDDFYDNDNKTSLKILRNQKLIEVDVETSQ